MCGVFLNNDVDLHTLCVQKDFNCYLRPFSTTLRLISLLKLKNKFSESDRNPADSPNKISLKLIEGFQGESLMTDSSITSHTLIKM